MSVHVCVYVHNMLTYMGLFEDKTQGQWKTATDTVFVCVCVCRVCVFVCV